MILKKPYAFLIKRFRLIHIILTALSLFIAVSSLQILNFFRDFIKNGYTATISSDLASSVINSLIYWALFLVIVALILIIIILKSKNKSTKAYLFATIYYIGLFIFITIAGSLIDGLEQNLWSAASARTYRDFATIIYYPQYVFVAILFIRALGFNVKQFNFKHDLQEIEITDSDSEEVELNINFETYKAERLIRRFIRELKYYFLENKFLIIVISIIMVVILGYIGIKNYEKLTYKYNENKYFNVGTFRAKVTESMVTDIDQGGNTIYDDKAFVVVKLNVTNNSVKENKIPYDNLKLNYNGNYIYPSLDLGIYFIDYGEPYMGGNINPGEQKTVVIPYLIDKKDINKVFKISIYTGTSAKKEDFKAKKIIVNLKPKKYMDVNVVSENGLNEVVSMANSLLKDSSINIKTIDIQTRYESCYKDECKKYTDVVAADNSYQNKQTLIIMDYDLSLDDTSDSYRSINGIGKFVESFMSFEYKIGNNTYTAHAINATPTRLKDKLILQTDGAILNANEINLYITIRNRTYLIKLR